MKNNLDEGFEIGLTVKDGILIKSFRFGEEPEQEAPCSKEISLIFAIKILFEQQINSCDLERLYHEYGYIKSDNN